MSPIGGGIDLSWLAPLDERGNRPVDSIEETVGQHAGTTVGLNVQNPQPDYEYIWVHNSDQGRLLARMRGAQIVQGSDPEMAYFVAQNDPNQPTPIDSGYLYGDVILARIPIERVRAERAEQERRSRAQLRDAGADFVEGATDVERDPKFNGGNPTRFRSASHMIAFEDESGHVVDQWSPDIGIVRDAKNDF